LSAIRLISILVIAGSCLCFGQSAEEGDLVPLLEQVLPAEFGERAGDESVLDDVEDVCAERIDLNRARSGALERIPFLTRRVARAIVARRRELGRITDWEQLSGIPGLTGDAWAALRRCTALEREARTGARDALSARLRIRAQREDMPRAGFVSGAFEGSPLALRSRLRIDAGGQFHAGVATDRDAGEATLADHISGHMTATDLGFIETLTLGDFTVSEGQGLAFRSSTGFGKRGDIFASGSPPAGIRASATTAESGILRGIATETALGPARVLAFASSTRFDASVDSATGEIVSIDESGLHRTASERRKDSRGSETATGGSVTCAWQLDGTDIRSGFSGIASRFSAPVNPVSPLAFGGNRAWAVAWHADVHFSTARIFASLARSHTSVTAIIAGGTAALPADWSMTVVARSYPPAFVSLHGGGFGERSGTAQNERGVCLAVQWTASKRAQLHAVFDQYRFPGASYLIDMPSAGHDAFLRASWTPVDAVTIGLQLLRETKDSPVAGRDAWGREVRPVLPCTRDLIRGDLRCAASDGSVLALRAEYLRTAAVPGGAEQGVLLHARLVHAPLPALRLVCHATLFNTSSYASRLYAMESDIPGAAANLALSGSGARLSISGEARFGSAVSLRAKWSSTLHDGATNFGSGDDAVVGDTQHVATLQLDARF
jgi:hypothetical protein